MTSLCESSLFVGAYVLGFMVDSLVLRAILRFLSPELRARVGRGLDVRDVGFWIGMCEHFLVVTFVLFHDFVAIGIVFAAKEFVRSDKVKQDPTYYLLGTMLNISMAVFWGLTLRKLLHFC